MGHVYATSNQQTSMLLHCRHGNCMGSQHSKPHLKTLCNFEQQTWLDTSRDAQSTCFEGSRSSCDMIVSGVVLGILAEEDRIMWWICPSDCIVERNSHHAFHCITIVSQVGVGVTPLIFEARSRAAEVDDFDSLAWPSCVRSGAFLSSESPNVAPPLQLSALQLARQPDASRPERPSSVPFISWSGDWRWDPWSVLLFVTWNVATIPPQGNTQLGPKPPKWDHFAPERGLCGGFSGNVRSFPR